MRGARRCGPILAFATVALIGHAAFAFAPEIEEAPPDLDPFAAEFELALDDADRDFDAIVLAHSGMLSPKDGCHNHKAAKERHWHRDGTAERGGVCSKQDGRTYRVLEVEAPAPEVKAPWDACPTEWAAMVADQDSFWAPTLQTRISGLLGCLGAAYPQRE